MSKKKIPDDLEENKFVFISARVDAALAAELDAFAAKEPYSPTRSQVIVRIIREFLDRQRKLDEEASKNR